MTEETPVSQEFWMNADGLCGIAVQFATYQQRPEGLVVLRVQASDEPQIDIAVVEADATALIDNQFHTFAFEPIDESAGKRFAFSVQFIGVTSRSPLALWKSSIADSTMGPHFNGQRSGRGTLSFKLYAAGESARLCDQATLKPDAVTTEA